MDFFLGFGTVRKGGVFVCFLRKNSLVGQLSLGLDI